MIKYESLKDLFSFLKFKNMPRKNQFDNLGRDITKCMHDVVLQCIKEVAIESQFHAIFVQNLGFQFMGYVLGNWQQVFILLNFEKVNDSVHVEIIYGVMLNTLLIQGRLKKTKIGEKLISIRIDGGDVLVECRTSDFVQIKEKVVLFFVWMSIIVHAKQTLQFKTF